MPGATRRHAPVPADGAVVPPGPSTVDLHAHTTRSDGVLEPAVLVRDAAAVGVRVFSLTDHDTLAGYRQVVADERSPGGDDARPRGRDQCTGDP